MYTHLYMGSDPNVSLPHIPDPAVCMDRTSRSIKHAYPRFSLLSAGLADGGTAGLIWGFVGVCVGFSLVYASVAEMASMSVFHYMSPGITVTDMSTGRPLQEDSTTGYRNLHLNEGKSF